LTNRRSLRDRRSACTSSRCHYRSRPGFALWERVETEDGRPGLLWRDYTTSDDIDIALPLLGIDAATLTRGELTPAQLALAAYDAVRDVAA
jgi:hypothetical protein